MGKLTNYFRIRLDSDTTREALNCLASARHIFQAISIWSVLVDMRQKTIRTCAIAAITVAEVAEQYLFFAVHAFDDERHASSHNQDGERASQSEHDSRLSEQLSEIERMPDIAV